MAKRFDPSTFRDLASLKLRYEKQLQRLSNDGKTTDCIEEAVKGALKNRTPAKRVSLVIYGDPQSGKTEMMICLTAKLLDQGTKTIVHLMNDSVDLLNQNLQRFKESGLAPAALSSSDLFSAVKKPRSAELVVLCKKNAKDLDNLRTYLESRGNLVVIDDEADYATPNGKVNKGLKTKINDLIGQIIGSSGSYIGVTATPARLDLNNTFQNETESWVRFKPHAHYTGPETFFPLNFPIDQSVPYRLTLLSASNQSKDAREALIRFLVTVAFLNRHRNSKELNYSLLVHTSGKKQDHESDRSLFSGLVQALTNATNSGFDSICKEVYETAVNLFPASDPNDLTQYVIENISRAYLVVLNSARDRVALGTSSAIPSSPFTIIIGGNIVSRGVTFPNLLSMYFTRSVQAKLQQDTYIQRARMFGARGPYLEYFDLTIPATLYSDWHKCFVFHRLALASIMDKLGSPVWLADSRIAVAANASIDRATVILDKGEMSFGLFDFSPLVDKLADNEPTSIGTLEKIQKKLGNEAFPKFLLEYVRVAARPGSIAIHPSSSVAGYKSNEQDNIARRRGFLGTNQLEKQKFPNSAHHFKIFYNRQGRARFFYKFEGSLQYLQNLRGFSNSTTGPA